jgi:hypothetical protein
MGRPDRNIVKDRCLRARHEGVWGADKYFYLLLTSTLAEMSSELHIPTALPLLGYIYILYMYSTNIGTKHFKHAAHSPFFLLFKMPFVS